MAIGEIIGELARKMQPQAKMTALKTPKNSGTPGSFADGSYKLRNPEDLTLDHGRQDWDKEPDLDEGEQKRIYMFVRDCFQQAYRARQEMELEWALATSFFEGRQWMRIASQTLNLIQLQMD